MRNIRIALLLFSTALHAAEEPLDLEFLEWLGQMAEVEELGVDIEKLLPSVEQASEPDDTDGKSL